MASAPYGSRLAACLGDGHHFQQVTVRIFEVEAAPAATFIDFAVRVAEGAASIWNPPVLDAFENGVELSIADVKSVMVASALARIEARPSPCFRFVGESEGEAVVNLHLGEVSVTLDG